MNLKIGLFRAIYALMLISASGTHAQSWKPNGPVTIVIPYGAGGGADALGRPLALELSKAWSQPVIVENVGGAEGLIGMNRVAQSEPNGRTLLLQVTSMVLTKHIPGLRGIDPATKLTPVGAFAESPVVLVASKKQAGASLQEMIETCKRSSQPCSMGGAGNLTKLGSRQFAAAANLPNLITVNYRASPQVTADLVGGTLSFGFLALPTAATQTANLKMMAIAGPRRVKQFPDVPTTREVGLTDYEYQVWWFLLVAKDTPPAIVAGISSALRHAAQRPDVLRAIDTAGAEPMWAGPRDADAIIKTVAGRFDRLVQTYGFN